jgi:mono/diheme cytochrome c family protein
LDRRFIVAGGKSQWMKVGTVVLLSVLIILFSFGCERGAKTESSGEEGREAYKSNGEQIYFSGTSRSGEPISATGGMMTHGRYWSCADCHGRSGKGRTVEMMHSFSTPDVRYKTLTSGHRHKEDAAEEHKEGVEHPPYTDETIKRAIMQGIDPAGNTLDAPMPRWNMSDGDLSDLLGYLKSLE